MITMHVRVVTTIDKAVLDTLDGKPATFEETIMSPVRPPVRRRLGATGPTLDLSDPYQALNPNGASSVGITIEGKFGGPHNTFSSVAVSITVTSRCDQTKAKVDEAKDLLFKEGLNALEFYADPLYEVLMKIVGKP